MGAGGPFDLEDESAWHSWREEKLRTRPARIEDLIVEVNDPRRLTLAEHGAIVERCRRANMAVYASRSAGEEDREIPRALGMQLGLVRLDRNFLADDDGISSITPGGGTAGEFIPYTERAMGWHTDGYYNPPARRILAMTLHCVRAAPAGGASALLDHELVYLRLRDADPAHVRALAAPDAMTVPPRLHEGRVARAAETGPVFSADAGASWLHMRYSARGTNIVWKDDAATRAALACLERILADENEPGLFRLRLAPGMGIVCNNVLHRRSAFSGGADGTRLLYRGRYLDRIAA